MEPAVWGIIGTLIGALASIGTTFINNRHNSRISKEEREAKLKFEMDAFQRKALLQLLEELKLYAEYLTSYHYSVLHKHKIDGDVLINNEVGNNDMRINYISKNNEISTLVQRVLDDRIRDSVLELVKTSVKLVNGIKMKSLVDKDLIEFHDVNSKFKNLVGEVLRASYLH